jgi:hypothetical protein
LGNEGIELIVVGVGDEGGIRLIVVLGVGFELCHPYQIIYVA